MDKSEVLDEFEKIIMNTVNSKYLEVVNEMNDGFNQLLQTALANADTFSNSIKFVIQQLKDDMSLTSPPRGMVIKDENQEMEENKYYASNQSYSTNGYNDGRNFNNNNYGNNYDQFSNKLDSFTTQKNTFNGDPKQNYTFPPKHNNDSFQKANTNQVSSHTYNPSLYKSSYGKGKPNQESKEEDDDWKLHKDKHYNTKVF